MLQPLVFSTGAYDYLGDDVATTAGWPRGEIEHRSFPDGERYLRIATECADRDVVLIGGTGSDADTLELYDLACGMAYGGSQCLTLVIPYFGYSTMERAVRPGEIVTAKHRARLLSSIPVAAHGTQVFMLDLHVASLAHYFEGAMRPVHVYGKAIVMAAARRLGGTDFVLACTDAGRAKWVESLANDLGVEAAFAYKRRVSGSATEVTGVSAQVAGKHVVIYDDMIRTGSSLIGAARAYAEAGAAAIDAIATHGIFPGDALARITATGLFGRLVVTDSHPRAQALRGPDLEVERTAQVLVEHLKENR